MTLSVGSLLCAWPQQAQAQLLRVDAGDLNGYTQPAPGWQLLTATSGPPGITLVPAPLDTVHVATFFPSAGVVAFPTDVLSIDPAESSELHRLSALVLANPSVLTIGGLVANRPYRLKLLLGAPAPWMELSERGGPWEELDSWARGVKLEIQLPGSTSPPVAWAPAARNLDCSTGLDPASLAPRTGGIVTVWILARTDGAGVLRLRLSSESGAAPVLNAFEVHAHEPLPVYYQRTAAGPLQGTGPAVAGFVSAFNAHQYQQAEDWALAQSDPWLAGVALCQLIGWLDGSADDRAALIPTARSALTAAQAQGHPGAAWLLDELQSLERAFAHLAARGYSQALLCPEQGGTGFLNPDCAGQASQHVGQARAHANAHIARRELAGIIAPVSGTTILADLVNWNAGSLSSAGFEPSPFTFTALKQSAAALASLNPLLSVNSQDADSQAFVDEFLRVFTDFTQLGFASSDFPQDLELPLFAAYAAAGAHPSTWDASQFSVLSDSQIAASWWGSLVALPSAQPAAPPWADGQRRALRTRRTVGRWWLRERLREGELGGGQGDDVEALLQLLPDYAAWRDAGDRLALDGLDEATRYGLEQTSDVANGYFAGPITDVEHSSEYTTNPFLVLRGVQGHTPRAARTGFAVGRHLIDGAGSPPFAAPTNLGRWHYQSHWFTTNGPGPAPSGPALDVLLNGRSMSPALSTSLHSPLPPSHPLRADLRTWAQAWRDDALETGALAAGKPLGFFAAAQWPSNTLGTGGLWYSEKDLLGDESLLAGPGFNYPAGLLLGAYRGSTDPNRWTFLLPAVRILRALKSWEDAGSPPGAVGSQAWAAAALFKNPGLGSFVIAHWPHLASDAQLNSLIDPLSGSTTYVDQALLARLELWATKSYLGQSQAMRYALLPVQPCLPHQVKSTIDLAPPLVNSTAYVRATFPLLTRYVLRTDRLFLNYREAATEILDAFRSADLAEGYPFTPLLGWSAAPGTSADLAVMINGRDPTGTRVSAFTYNFGALPALIELALDEGLQPGAYLIEVAPITAGCDTFPLGTLPVLSVVDKPGRGASALLLLPPGLALVKVTRTGPALAALASYDLAVDPPQVTLLEQGPAQTLEIRVRVANLGSQSSPAAVFALSVAGLAADGSVLPFGPGGELALHVQSVSLPGSVQWNAPEVEIVVQLPVDVALAALLDSGSGLLLRAEVAPTAGEADRLNNKQSRGWLPGQLLAGRD
ncbi:MAG: hypothetical protein ACT4PU_03300 [Planctomycetota bacterium]